MSSSVFWFLLFLLLKIRMMTTFLSSFSYVAAFLFPVLFFILWQPHFLTALNKRSLKNNVAVRRKKKIKDVSEDASSGDEISLGNWHLHHERLLFFFLSV